MFDKRPTNYFDCLVKIASAVGGVAIAIVALFVVFVNSPSQLMVCAYIVGALCLMGLGFGLLAARRAPQSDRIDNEGLSTPSR